MVAALVAVIRSRFQPHDSIALGLSGGVDSVVLLHALHAARQAASFELSAHHVHHGLSSHATAWTDFCAELCARLQVPYSYTRVNVPRRPQESLEAAAREARHRALRELPVEIVALAHHADDQAETLLLQLLRGAGVAGLAAMPEWSPGRPGFWRPLLGYTRADLLAWAQSRALVWIEDESNDDLRWRRNALRHEITPRLAEFFPGYPQTLVRSARHCAEAADLLAQLACLDGLPASIEDGLDLAQLRALPPGRAKNLLRQYFHLAGLVPPSEARLAALMRNLESERPDARLELTCAGARLVRESTCLRFVLPALEDFDLVWKGEAELCLPHGTLRCQPAQGTGLCRETLGKGRYRVLPCPPGARIVLQPDGRGRSVRELLRAGGVPVWARGSWPVLCCDGEVAAVPNHAIAQRWRCPPEEEGFALSWHPRAFATPRK